jgi:hypothetical protein
MALSPLTIANWYLTGGNTSVEPPVALGEVTLHLNKDCTSPTGPVSAKIKSVFALDVNGAPVGSPLFWPNSELVPNDSVYIMNVYAADGQPIGGPVPITVGPSSSGTGFGESFGSSFGS